LKDIGKIIAHLELASVDYRFNGRRLETDGAVLYCDDEGHIIDAKRKDDNPAPVARGLIGVDARLRK
jgi:hypothetical protein